MNIKVEFDNNKIDGNQCNSIIYDTINNNLFMKRCTKNKMENSNSCDIHKYYNLLNSEQLNEINKWLNNDNTTKTKLCLMCKRFTFSNYINNNETNVVDKCIDCMLYTDQHKKQNNKSILKCKWYDVNGKPCQNEYLDNNKYCELHMYALEYSDDDKEK